MVSQEREKDDANSEEGLDDHTEDPTFGGSDKLISCQQQSTKSWLN
jgi:hypothetical protein